MICRPNPTHFLFLFSLQLKNSFHIFRPSKKMKKKTMTWKFHEIQISMSLSKVLLKYRYYNLHTTNNCFCKRQQNSMAPTETVWPAKPEYSFTGPCTENVCQPLLQKSVTRGIKEQLRSCFLLTDHWCNVLAKHVWQT